MSWIYVIQINAGVVFTSKKEFFFQFIFLIPYAYKEEN